MYVHHYPTQREFLAEIDRFCTLPSMYWIRWSLIADTHGITPMAIEILLNNNLCHFLGGNPYFRTNFEKLKQRINKEYPQDPLAQSLCHRIDHSISKIVQLPSEVVSLIVRHYDEVKPLRFYSAPRLVSKTWHTGCRQAMIDALNRTKKPLKTFLPKPDIMHLCTYGHQLRRLDLKGLDHLNILDIGKYFPNLEYLGFDTLDQRGLKFLSNHLPFLTVLKTRYLLQFDLFQTDPPQYPAGLKKLSIRALTAKGYAAIVKSCPILESLKIEISFDEFPHPLPTMIRKLGLKTTKVMYPSQPLPASLQSLLFHVQKSEGQRIDLSKMQLNSTLRTLDVSDCLFPFIIPKSVTTFRLQMIQSLWESGEILPACIDTFFYLPPINSVGLIPSLPDRIKLLAVKDQKCTQLPALPTSLRKLEIDASLEKLLILPEFTKSASITLPKLRDLKLNHHLQRLALHKWNQLQMPDLTNHLKIIFVENAQIREITYLPDSLRILLLHQCRSLKEIKMLNSGLYVLHLLSCESFESLPSQFPDELRSVLIHYCPIKTLPQFNQKIRFVGLSNTKILESDLNAFYQANKNVSRFAT